MRHRDGYVQIGAHYTRDLKRTYRTTARLRAAPSACSGSWAPSSCCRPPSGHGSPGTAVAYAAWGVVICVLPDATLWLILLRNRAVFAVEVKVEMTDRRISSRIATQSTTIKWTVVKRVLQAGGCWIFVVNRLQSVTLYQAALSPLERGQLTAFLNTRP